MSPVYLYNLFILSIFSIWQLFPCHFLIFLLHISLRSLCNLLSIASSAYICLQQAPSTPFPPASPGPHAAHTPQDLRGKIGMPGAGSLSPGRIYRRWSVLERMAGSRRFQFMLNNVYKLVTLLMSINAEGSIDTTGIPNIHNSHISRTV